MTQAQSQVSFIPGSEKEHLHQFNLSANYGIEQFIQALYSFSEISDDPVGDEDEYALE